MTTYSRELAAIRHEVPDRIPVDAIIVENGPALAAFLGIKEQDPRALLGLDGRIHGLGYLGPKPESRSDKPLDEWGATAYNEYGAGHNYPLGDVSTVRAVEAYAWPDPVLYDYQAAAESARKAPEGVPLRGPGWHPVFCRACSLFGMEEAMMKMAAEPAVFEAAIDRITACTNAMLDRYLAACGDRVPIALIEDDFASQRGLMMSPAVWRQFLKPRYARLFATAKKHGKYVWFHSCGDITAVLPDLIDIGMDVWETVQLHTLPMPPEELKRRYGKAITFFGGVNTQTLPFKSPNEVRREVRRCIDALGKGGGYILGPDHHIKPDVSAENTMALFEEAKGYSREGYTSGPRHNS
jgi:uroporphyrinogen decarboxylase